LKWNFTESKIWSSLDYKASPALFGKCTPEENNLRLNIEGLIIICTGEQLDKPIKKTATLLIRSVAYG